jgi:hypothetical protein
MRGPREQKAIFVCNVCFLHQLDFRDRDIYRDFYSFGIRFFLERRGGGGGRETDVHEKEPRARARSLKARGLLALVVRAWWWCAGERGAATSRTRRKVGGGTVVVSFLSDFFFRAAGRGGAFECAPLFFFAPLLTAFLVRGRGPGKRAREGGAPRKGGWEGGNKGFGAGGKIEKFGGEKKSRRGPRSHPLDQKGGGGGGRSRAACPTRLRSRAAAGVRTGEVVLEIGAGEGRNRVFCVFVLWSSFFGGGGGAGAGK